MSKRRFRSVPQSDERSYPTLGSFDRQDRRSFLAKLGATVLGAGTLAAGLAGCGGRSVNSQPDMGHPPGAMPIPDARLDGASPDGPVMMGVAPEPDARIDEPDGPTMAGVPRMPDAGIDKKDAIAAPGYAPLPDALIDDPNP
jgi:hypothetical protein